MTRLATTLASPSALWVGVTGTISRMTSLAALGSADFAGLETVERDADRIRATSRHWLM